MAGEFLPIRDLTRKKLEKLYHIRRLSKSPHKILCFLRRSASFLSAPDPRILAGIPTPEPPGEPPARMPPRKPRSPKKRPNTPAGPRVRWSGFRPFLDFWGAEIPRYFQLETLAAAVEWAIRERRARFLLEGVQAALGPAPLSSLHFELFQEGRYQLIFRLRAANVKQKRGALGFVVAKNHKQASEVARAEHRNLALLHRRAPGNVVRPYAGGTLFLPGRRDQPGRELYAYFTQWLGPYHELGLNAACQCILNIPKRHTFTREQTETIKRDILAVILSTYDERARDCMGLPQIASGDFVATHPDKGPVKLKLIACRKMLERIPPDRLLNLLIDAEWDWGGAPFRLIPENPARFFEAMRKGLGPARAAQWLAQYQTAAARKAFREPLPGYLTSLPAP